MTTDKARKRAVRSRMQKTGERYAAAHRHVVATSPRPDPEPAALPPRVAEPATSEEAVRKSTGRGWDDWFRDLDAWGATAHTHRDIARYVHETYEISGWWAQNVTVGYERARGMREVHQTTRGFEVSVSKTLDAPPADVWPAVTDARRRGRWLEGGVVRLHSTTPRQARFDVLGDDTTLTVYLDAKGPDRCVATFNHSGLAGADAVARSRLVWRSRLVALAASLGASRSSTRVASGRRRAS